MSKHDGITGAIALIVAGAIYFIAGPWAALAAIGCGLVILIVIHLRGSEEKPEPIKSGTLCLVGVLAQPSTAQTTRILSVLNVKLTPTSGPRTDVLLAVMNQDETRDFYAQCTPLVLRNSPNELARGTYDLKWEHSFDKCVSIGAGATCNLLIATVETDHKNGLATMQIWGLSAEGEKKQCEWSRWNTELNEKLPEYELKVSIFSDGTKGPFSERFILRPKAWYGPLEMVKIGT